MVTLKVEINSRHENGHMHSNIISIEFSDSHINDFLVEPNIDWADLNSKVIGLSEYLSAVKEQMSINKIEVPDPNFWITEGIIVGVNEITMSEDYDRYLIEDKLYTGDFI